MTPFRKWVSSNLPKKTNNPNQVFPLGKLGSDYIGLVPLTGLEPVLWKPERDFKSRVSTYSTTAACPPMTGDIKLHNKCQHIDTAYGSIFSVNRQVLQLVEIQREGLQTVV